MFRVIENQSTHPSVNHVIPTVVEEAMGDQIEDTNRGNLEGNRFVPYPQSFDESRRGPYQGQDNYYDDYYAPREPEYGYRQRGGYNYPQGRYGNYGGYAYGRGYFG
ncbi:hypothetical protein CEXT_469621 [Caerostris extrusa]|uniref:Uncharacterized protein n=1 Tax=Caerostris extrusa TaxID=172846 RepID=A0AAV4VYK6_CAEEX|nr:hypothetical protein CEXT_469621 [Caerostris extrusa]